RTHNTQVQCHCHRGELIMMRKSSRPLALRLVVLVPLLLFGTGSVHAEGPVRLLKTLPVPVSAANTTAGALYFFDISWVDQATGTYYLADRSNQAVDILDAAETAVTQL